MTYIRASEIGCALDCDLKTGRHLRTGGTATDDAPKINAAMAAASATNPITLIIDGSALISGLFLPAGGYWSIAGLGCGTGFYIKSGTNNDGIHNGGPSAALPTNPGPPAPARGKNVSLSNFTLNGNQGNGKDGDSTSGLRQGASDSTWYFGIDLMNLDNIVMQNVVVVNVPSFHVRLSNVGNVAVSGCVFQSKGLSTDGLHFDGPANDIVITQCKFATGDDSIALNCPEGYTGNISRVSVSNCTFNSLSLMRLYTQNGYPNKSVIDTVSVKNCTATLTEAAFLIGLADGSLPNSVTGLTISDCNVTASCVLAMAENLGTATLRNVTFTPSQSGVAWITPQANKICAIVRPSPLYGNIRSVGSSLTLENCVIQRKSDTEVAAIIVENGSSIANLIFNGFSVQDAGQYKPLSEFIHIGDGTIGKLAIASLTGTNVEKLSANFGFSSIRSIAGAGVLGTGWEFPDAPMANGTPYISERTGKPSIKVDGVVELYTSV